jgi:hypothetical protein
MNTKIVTVVSLVDWRPDFIDLQYSSLKKHIKDPFEYVVINNSFNRARRKNISKECKKLGVSEIKVKRNLRLAIREYRFAFRLVEWSKSRRKIAGGPQYGMNTGKSKFKLFGKNIMFFQYRDVTVACSYGMNYITKKIFPRLETRYFMILDSDMFFINDFSISKFMENSDLAFTPQYRGRFGQVYYAWNGFVLVDKEKVKDFSSHDWRYGNVEGFSTDVGGKSSTIVAGYAKKYRIKHVNTLSISTNGTEKLGALTKFSLSINGGKNLLVSTNYNGLIINLVEYESESHISTFLPRVKSINDSEFLEFLQNFLNSVSKFIIDIDWPQPLFIEFLPFVDSAPIVIHYKSGSNYQPFATDDYNYKKTVILKLILENS